MADLQTQDPTNSPPPDVGQPSAFDNAMDSDASDTNTTLTPQAAPTAPVSVPSAPAATPEAPQSKLPSLNEFLSKADDDHQKTLPTLNEFMEKNDTPLGEAALNRFNPFQNDQELSEGMRQWAQGQKFYGIAGAYNKTYDAIGNIAEAAGKGYMETFNQEAPLDEDNAKALKEAGIYKNYLNMKDIMNKSLMDGLIIPAAMTLDRSITATNARANFLLQQTAKALKTEVMEAPIGGASAALEQLDRETNTSIGQTISNTAQGLSEGFPKETMGALPFGTEEAIGDFMAVGALRPLPPEIAVPKANGVLDGEGVYFGTEKMTPEQQQAQDLAARMYPEAHADYHGEAQAEVPEPETMTVHEISRQVDPETFKQYDELDRQQQNNRQAYADARDAQRQEVEASAPHADEIADLQEKLENEETNSRQTTRRQAALDRLIKERNDYISESMKTENDERAALSGQMQKNDYAMRDLAPKVGAAYREAESRIPAAQAPAADISSPAEVAPPAEQSEPINVKSYVDDYIAGKNRESLEHQQFAANNGPEIEKEFQSRAKSETSPVRSPEEQRAFIQSNFKKRAIAAGRPEEEAEAVSQLEAARYETLAKQYPKYSAEEWYRRESASLKKGGNVSKEMELAQADGFADAETIKFRRDLGRMDRGEVPRGNVLRLGRTPEVLSKVAGNELPLTISPSVVKKIEGSKHGISRVITGRLMSLLRDPIAIFDSETVPGDIVAVVSAKNEAGEIINVPIVIGKDGEGANTIKSVYGREHDGWYSEQAEKGNLRYLNKKKASELPGLSAYGQGEVIQKPNSSVLTEDDFVKKNEGGELSQENQGNKSIGGFVKKLLGKEEGDLEQSANGKIRLSSDEAKATITLFKDANASTLIHEKGHEWLDQLVRLSSEDGAPAQMKKDVETLRNYAGNKEGKYSGFTKAGHEKIARGFERYLMEGTSPSKELASVFGKFKQWLTDIYKTVQKLRSPINDDIRDVFDRLLSANPEKTVIAPEREAGKMMADLHEEDAKSTQPPEANKVGDTVAKETDLTAKQHKEEAHGALTDAAETGNIPEETAGDTGLGGEGETGGQGSVQEPEQVSTGGSGAPAESGGARAEQPAKPEPDAFGNTGSDLVDKAGNIRLDNINTTGDIKQILRDAAERNGNFDAERRGVVSDGKVLDLADALGLDPSFISKRKVGESFNAEQIKVIEKMLADSTKAVRSAMVTFRDSAKAEEDVAALQKVLARNDMIQGHFSGVTAEAGRALRALKKTQSFWEEGDLELNQFLNKRANQNLDLNQLSEMAEFASKLQTPEQLAKFMQDSQKSGFKDAIKFYYVNALISGPITHMRYAVGNAVNALWRPLVQIPLAAVSGTLRGAEAGDRIYLAESKAQLYAMTKGARDGYRAAIDAYQTGLMPDPSVQGEMALEGRNVAFNPIPGTFGKIIGQPAKVVTAIHSFFYTLRYEQNIAGLAVRDALDAGKDGTAFDLHVAGLTKSPSEEMMESAKADALKELYMAPEKYNSAMANLTRFTNQSLLAKIMIPFMKIGTQITKNAFLEQTPLGLLSDEIRSNLMGANGGAARDLQTGKIAGGVALMGALSLMTSEGKANGDGPSDPSQRAVWLLTHRPNSMSIGGITIPYQGLGSLGMLMRFSANMTETAQHWSDEDGSALALAALQGLTKSVLDDNFMRGVKDFLDAVYHPQEYGARYIQDFATNWLPLSVGVSQVDRMVDPYQREVRSHGMENAWGILDAARAKIPGLSEGLFPRRDMFGAPILNNGETDRYKNDPVVRVMDGLQIGVSKIEPKILGVPLTDKQYDDYSKLAGQRAKFMLNNTITQPGFSTMPKGEQIKFIKTTIEEARKDVQSYITMKYPSIVQQAYKDKVQVLKTGKK